MTELSTPGADRIAFRGKRPRVTIKLAQTLDGRIATRTGQSQWISGQASLAFAHELRASHDAVLVGIGTVLCDNPRLTVRLVVGPNPLRVVVDSKARIPLDSNLLAEGPERTVIATSAAASTERVAAISRRGARVVTVGAAPDGRLDLGELLARLGADGVRSLMVEGGACLVTSLLRERLVDRLVVCIAPKLLGSGLEAIGDLGIRNLADALTFARTEIHRLGDDIIFDGTLDLDSRTNPPELSGEVDARGSKIGARTR